MTNQPATLEPTTFVEARRRKLSDRLAQQGLDALLVFSPANRRYLTGFTGSFGYAVAFASEAPPAFLTDWRYVEQAGAQIPGAQVTELPKNKHLWTPLRNALANAGVQRLGIEAAHVSFAWAQEAQAELAGTELVPTRGLVEGLRTVKDEYEIACLSEAQRITDEVFSQVLPLVQPGVSERALAVELRHRIELAGAENYPGLPIVASGWRAALPHGRASEKRIEKGEFVLFDFGALVDGYHSDMTRTVACRKVGDREREVYGLVLEALEAGVQLATTPGRTGQEIDRACREPIRRGGYREYEHGFSVGHGLGLEVHEDPFLSETLLEELRPGMVITVEKGIYVPEGNGVRIEDTVVVAEGGGRVLNSTGRELREL